MKIVLVSEYYYPNIGGVEIVFQNLAEQLAKKHDVHIVTCKLKGTKNEEVFNNVHIHRIFTFPFADRYFFPFFSIFKLLKISRNADIIHGTLYNAAFPAWFCGKVLRKKIILTVHEVLGDRLTKVFEISKISAFFHMFLEKIILKLKFDYYICVSDSAKRDLEKLKIPKNKIRRIYNGISDDLYNFKCKDKPDLRKELNLPEKSFLYLYFGRPGVSKGLEYLIRAIPEIILKIPESKFILILGNKPLSRYNLILDLINKLKIEKNIILYPSKPLSELKKYIRACDLGVIPSLSEGFGFTAAECCALGIPVAVSKVDSLPEVVCGKVIFMEPKNPKSISQAVINAYRKRFDEIPAKKFSWISNASEHEEVYILRR